MKTFAVFNWILIKVAALKDQIAVYSLQLYSTVPTQEFSYAVDNVLWVGKFWPREWFTVLYPDLDYSTWLPGYTGTELYNCTVL